MSGGIFQYVEYKLEEDVEFHSIPLLHAAEWWGWNDWTPDQFQEACNIYNESP